MPHLSLAELAARGVVTDEWRRWQQGECDTYAMALISEDPSLGLGVALDEWDIACHFFAHDGAYAYDSAGRHYLPYLGVQPDAPFAESLLNQDPQQWGTEEDPANYPDALAHARRHQIIPTREQAA